MTILCNECLSENIVPFHIAGGKCKKCGSYNTTRTTKNSGVNDVSNMAAVESASLSDNMVMVSPIDLSSNSTSVAAVNAAEEASTDSTVSSGTTPPPAEDMDSIHDTVSSGTTPESSPPAITGTVGEVYTVSPNLTNRTVTIRNSEVTFTDPIDVRDPTSSNLLGLSPGAADSDDSRGFDINGMNWVPGNLEWIPKPKNGTVAGLEGAEVLALRDAVPKTVSYSEGADADAVVKDDPDRYSFSFNEVEAGNGTDAGAANLTAAATADDRDIAAGEYDRVVEIRGHSGDKIGQMKDSERRVDGCIYDV